jgi:hypothetical protein
MRMPRPESLSDLNFFYVYVRVRIIEVLSLCRLCIYMVLMTRMVLSRSPSRDEDILSTYT